MCNCLIESKESMLNKHIFGGKVRKAEYGQFYLRISFYDTPTRKNIPIDMLYCPFCGKKLRKTKTETTDTISMNL